MKYQRVYEAFAGCSADRLYSRCWRCCALCVCAMVLQCGPIRTSSVTICCQRETCCSKHVWLIRSPGRSQNVFSKWDNFVLSLTLSSFLSLFSFFVQCFSSFLCTIYFLFVAFTTQKMCCQLFAELDIGFSTFSLTNRCREKLNQNTSFILHQGLNIGVPSSAARHYPAFKSLLSLLLASAF